ncbi:MAG TPA: 3-oxo-tetronate kinase, partial [Burkholderiaceae bacterium]|nr:3-oxo-tetronate kinase [Burkholderiaceae bacterium]
MGIALGCIADDFTGATDLANTLTKGGLRTVQVNGVPRAELPLPDADAVVVALKSRTAPAREAVDESLRALAWLRSRGADRFLFKVCSTFDSTDAGNIGPVADALLDALGGDLAVVCPAFPANGRSVYQGHLCVGSQLLSDSPMRDHPLTPMRDANLVRVLGRQTAHRVGLLPHAFVRLGAEAVHAALERLRSDGVRYAVADATDDEDLLVLAQGARDLPLLVGGSGIALGLPENARARRAAPSRDRAEADVPRGGPALVLAGSCSQATRGQVDWFARVRPTRRLDAAALVAGSGELDAATQWLHEHVARGPCLIYSSAAPADVQALQDALGADGRARAAEAIEAAFAHLARQAIAAGVRRLVVAGGETSGAVVQALGIEALAIGAEIDPGVPWTATPGAAPLALALKSG